MVLLKFFYPQPFFCFHVCNSQSFQFGFRRCRHYGLFYLSRDVYANQKAI